ncbi:hypothetical protein HPP92_003140 [Vanilla planifolia]|uniref:adenylate dimethylallyltransferase (ADP/ATP-dependent) n=1 Tax=Vanilla planifolia TaxID=51239 RepID=A0A835PAF1_VANPL|nr:hypothetical protein HPP92_027824 [Vanilla planifolia]KAG0503068.1 hypothetical protein HPP92_003140 [Vanilla planifolia]
MASLVSLYKAILVERSQMFGKFRQQKHLSDFAVDDYHPFFFLFRIIHSLYQLPRPLPTKSRAIFILGSSGTGKSKLAIGLALRFRGEVINSDKMQVYAGLEVITNKVTPKECAGVPHLLLGELHPEADFTATEFRRRATILSDDITSRGRLPIIAGGSNSFIRELVEGDGAAFRLRYDCCFICVDVEQPDLDDFVGERVDQMVEQGLVDEARDLFDPAADYTKGIRRSIGVPEMDKYLRREARAREEERAALLAEALDEIKENTKRLTRVQRQKIRRFEADDSWPLFRVDATEAVRRRRDEAAERVWLRTVEAPAIELVNWFVGGVRLVNRCGGAVAACGEEVAIIAAMGTTN